MRCLVTRSWALRLLLLHSVNSVLSLISFWIKFSHHLCFQMSLFLSSLCLLHPLPLCPLSTSFCLPAVILLFVSLLYVSPGMKTTVSEAEHPLLCEGTRRVKGDLALALMITYKDDQSKLKKVAITTVTILTTDKKMAHISDMPRKLFNRQSQLISSFPLPPTPQILDKLLDRESQTHKPQTLSSFYSSKPAAGSQRSPSKHTATNHSGVSGATGGVSKHAPSSSSATSVAASSSSSSSAVALAGEELAHQAELNPVQNNPAGENTAETREHGENRHPLYGCHILLYCSAATKSLKNSDCNCYISLYSTYNKLGNFRCGCINFASICSIYVALIVWLMEKQKWMFLFVCGTASAQFMGCNSNEGSNSIFTQI